MSEISITQQHSLSQEAARAAAQKVADKLAGEYGLNALRALRAGENASYLAARSGRAHSPR